MSYILDALKKSEQERKQGQIPSPADFAQPPIQSRETRAVWPWVLMAVLISNMAILLIWKPWQPPAVPGAKNQSSHEIVSSTSGSPGKVDPLPARASNNNTPQPQQASSNMATPTVARKQTGQADQKPDVETRADNLNPPTAAMSREEQPTITATEFEKTSTRAETVRVGAESEPATEMAKADDNRMPQAYYIPQLQELPASIRSQIPDMAFSSHMYSSLPRFRSITINGRRVKEGNYYNDDIYVDEITESGAILRFQDTRFEVDVLGQWGGN